MSRDLKRVPWQQIPYKVRAAVWPWLVRADGYVSWWAIPRQWNEDPYVDALVAHAPPDFDKAPRWVNPRLDLWGTSQALWLTHEDDPDAWDRLYRDAPVVDHAFRAVPAQIDWTTSCYGVIGQATPYEVLGLEPFVNRTWDDWLDSVTAHYGALILPEESVGARAGCLGYRFTNAGKPVYWRGNRVRVQAYYQGPDHPGPRYEIHPPRSA